MVWHHGKLLFALLASSLPQGVHADADDAALERAYFQLVCIGAVQRRLETSGDADEFAEIVSDQAWIVVEISTMVPARIQALHEAARAKGSEANAFHHCLTAPLPG